METLRRKNSPAVKAVAVSLALFFNLNCATPASEGIIGMSNSRDINKGHCKERAEAVNKLVLKFAMTQDEEAIKVLKEAVNYDCNEVAEAAEMAIHAIKSKTKLRTDH